MFGGVIRLKKVFLYFSTLLLLLVAGCESGNKMNEIEVEYDGATVEIPNGYQEWELSPQFEYETQSKSGETLTYEVIGKKDVFGITSGFPIVSNEETNEKQKFFWWYWGEEDIKNQPVKVLGIKKGQAN